MVIEQREKAMQARFEKLGLNLAFENSPTHVITKDGSYQRYGWSVNRGTLDDDDFGIITLESDFGEEASRLTSPEVRINWLEENYEKVLEVVKDKLEKGDIFGWPDLFP